jgi:hypothetical protein
MKRLFLKGLGLWGGLLMGTFVGAEPIHVTFVIHFDPLLAPGGQVQEASYEAERDNLLWLSNYLEELETQGKGVPRLTLEVAGDHAEFYREDKKGLDLLKRLYQKGIHSWGIHFHTNYKEGKHRWLEAPRSSAEGVRQRVTQDHIREVDALIGEMIGSQEGQKIRSVNHTITGHFLDSKTAIEEGFYLRTGGSNEVMNLFFDHDVYNPWRPQIGWALQEDRKSRWILVPQSPVLGTIGEHGPIPPGISPKYTQGMHRMMWQDLSLPAMKRKFLHLYLEWRYQQEKGLLPKVWVLGWHEHTNNLYPDDGRYGNPRNLRDEVMEFVQWLNENFIGKKTKSGQEMAQYSNVEEVAQEYLAWEKRFPEASSFNYATKEQDWQLYPYYLKGLARELMYSHYVEEVGGLGIQAHKLARTSGRYWSFQNGKMVSSQPQQEIYLLWSEEGAKSVNLSRWISNPVVCVDGLSGNSLVQDAQKLKVSELPIVCMRRS